VTTPLFDYRVVSAFLALPDEVEVNPGPPSYEGVSDTVGPAVVVTVGGGPGLRLEQQWDDVMVSFDIAGDQNDPDGAISLAHVVDQRILGLNRTQNVGGIRVQFATRAGGRPTPVSVDDGDRTHLAVSYVWRVESGV
jgi:hypothetical protein